jgi:hypothetical protein
MLMRMPCRMRHLPHLHQGEEAGSHLFGGASRRRTFGYTQRFHPSLSKHINGSFACCTKSTLTYELSAVDY